MLPLLLGLHLTALQFLWRKRDRTVNASPRESGQQRMPDLQLRPVVVGDEGQRSPAYEDDVPKDQDRAVWVAVDQGGVACVCDGTSSSWRAEDAARFVTSFVREHRGLWTNKAGDHSYDADSWFLKCVNHIVDGLLRLREKGQQEPIKLPELGSEGERAIHEENVRNFRRTSHQTTLIAARLDYHIQGGESILRIRHFKVGDSELFVFAPDGRLLETTSELVWDRSQPLQAPGATPNSLPVKRRLRFPHAAATDVLPDALLRKAPHFATFYCDPRASVLVTSDGLVDAFDGPAEMGAWLMEHGSKIDSATALNDLHSRLRQRGGDDDISFVWVPSPFGTT